jgi:flagellar protein FliS
LELVVLLYDGALTSLVQTRRALEQQDLVAKGAAMSKAMAIVSHLQGTLDMKEGGEIAEQLDRLYAYVMDRLIDANVRRDAAAVEDAIRVMDRLRSAWAQVAGQPAGLRP